MIFLDSDSVIAFLRGKPNIARFFAEHKNSIFAIPVPVLYEIYYGFYFPPLSTNFQKDIGFLEKLRNEEKKLIRLLKDIKVFDLTLPAIKKSAEISATLDVKGKSVGKFDVLIAGIILANGYNEILTNNFSHYENISGLIIHTF
ncbi:MAG: PIN domain-containing protein [Promethearchaeati archaeon]